MPRKPLEYNATCVQRVDIAEGLAIFRVKADSDDIKTFDPGQYTVLGMNHPEKGPVSRAYSIASPPDTLPGYFEFYVRYVRQPASTNPLTHLLFTLQEGDRLNIGTKIRGHFTVEHEVGASDPRLRLCVAAGTGLAPFTSMTFHEKHLGRDPADKYLVLHGVSQPHDLGYRLEMEKLMNEGRSYARYVPTVSSRELAPGAWPEGGTRGRVEHLLEPGRIENLERMAGLQPGDLRPDKAVIFICGLQGTIANTVMAMLWRGFVPRDLKLRNAFGIPPETPATLFFEQYDADPIMDLKDPALMAEARRRLETAGVALLPLQEPAAGPATG